MTTLGADRLCSSRTWFALAAATAFLAFSLWSAWLLVSNPRPSLAWSWQTDRVAEESTTIYAALGFVTGPTDRTAGAVAADESPRPAKATAPADDAQENATGDDATPQRGDTLSPAASPADLDAFLVRLCDALALDPNDIRSYGTIVEVLRRQGRDEDADRLSDLAARLTLRGSSFQIARIDRKLAHGDYAEAVNRLDALARSQTSRKEFPEALARITALPAARPLIMERLTTEPPPPWRQKYFAALFALMPTAELPTILFEDFVLRRGTYTDREIDDYIGASLKSGNLAAARTAWRLYNQKRGVEQTDLVFDGHFERAPDGMLGWTSLKSPGVTKVYVPNPANPERRVLRVEFFGLKNSNPRLSQFLFLDPGKYVLTTSVKPLALQAEKGVLWRTECVDLSQGTLTTLGTTEPIKGSHDWTRYTVPFEVPDTGCPVQRLTFTVAGQGALDRQIQGAVLTESVAIMRQEPAK